MRALQKVDNFMHWLLRAMLIAVFGIMTVIATVQIIFRFVLQNPLTWTDEVCRYCLIWITLLGVAVAAERKSHISIDFICNIVPASVVVVLEKFWNICSIVFCGFVIKYGFDLAVLNMAQYSAGMHIQLGYIYFAVPIGGIGIIYYNLVQLFGIDKRLAAIKNTEKEKK